MMTLSIHIFYEFPLNTCDNSTDKNNTHGYLSIIHLNIIHFMFYTRNFIPILIRKHTIHLFLPQQKTVTASPSAQFPPAVAAREMLPGNAFQNWLHLTADRGRIFAAGVKLAATRRIERTRQIAVEKHFRRI